MRGSEFAQLQAFVAVAEHGNFARAARHLGVSASALSQTIRTLEARIGARLLNRTTRSVAVSSAGEQLLGRLLPAMRDLDTAVMAATDIGTTPSGRLRINSIRLAAMHYLAPSITKFLEAYPRIDLEIVTDDRLADIVATGFDAGIRLGEKLQRDMVAVKIGGPLRLVAVAAPAYLAKFGSPAHPRDLSNHRCLNTRWPTDGSLYRWEFERAGEELEVQVDGPLISEAEILIGAARDGLGIAYLMDIQVGDALARGQLVELLSDWSPTFPGFYLYYPDRRQVSPALRAFIDHCVAVA